MNKDKIIRRTSKLLEDAMVRRIKVFKRPAVIAGGFTPVNPAKDALGIPKSTVLEWLKEYSGQDRTEAEYEIAFRNHRPRQFLAETKKYGDKEYLIWVGARTSPDSNFVPRGCWRLTGDEETPFIEWSF